MISRMQWWNRAATIERLKVLRRRAAVPAWILGALALLREAADSWGGAVLVWRWAESTPGIAWVTSSTGLVVLALLWVGFLLVRPWSWVGSTGWRLERVRTLVVEAAEMVEADGKKPPPRDFREAFDNTRSYMHARDLLDDACAAHVAIGFDAFMAREERMYKEADVELDRRVVFAAQLRRIARSLTAVDVDPGFRIPESFTEWSVKHSPNIRPTKW